MTAEEEKQIEVISTHTPHARCDQEWHVCGKRTYISTHTPHARCDASGYVGSRCNMLFLLTHLMRGVTQAD